MPVNPTTSLGFNALPLIFACIFACFCVCQAQPPQERTREQFAALMSQLSPEMTRDEVEAILGKPDDIRTKYDPGGIRSVETGEIWRYGTNGHLTLTIERISRKAVEVIGRWTGGEQELSDRSGVISIYNASDRSLPLAQFKLKYLENGSTSTGATIKYEEGRMLVAVFEGEKTTAQSPEYKP